MDGLSTRLYRRLGTRHLLLMLAAGWSSAVLLAVVFVTIVTRLYIKMPAPESALVTSLSVAGVTVGVAAAFTIVATRSRSVIAWMKGSRDESVASAAWTEAARMPSTMIKIGYPLLVLCVLPANARFNASADLPWFSLLAVGLAVLMLIGLGLALELAIVSYFLRPVVTEISVHYPKSGYGSRQTPSSLLRRIVASVLLVVPTSGWLAAAATAQETRPSYFVLYVVLASLGITMTYSLILTLALADAFVRPVGDLLEATRRVAAGDLTTRVPLVSTDELGQLTRSFNEMVQGLSERKALHSALGAYVDPVVADRLLAEGEILSGDEIDVTIMFVDIVGYTMRAENMQASAVVAELNEFFQIVIPIVNEHSGHANKLLGDGLMAVFGAPVPLEDHADQALHAAYEIQRQMRDRYGGDLRVGMGLNSGAAIVGSTGGGSKLDYTVIGDPVNVASRIEALTRETGDDILLSESTRDRLTTVPGAVLPRGSTPIKGRAAPVRIFAALTRPA